MKIRYNKGVLDTNSVGEPRHYSLDPEGGDLILSYATRGECVVAGCTDDDIATAQANPGTWIECPRGPENDSTVEALTNVCAGVVEVATDALRKKLEVVTAERDALIEAGTLAVNIMHAQCGCGDCCMCHNRQNLFAVIALAEPKKEETT